MIHSVRPSVRLLHDESIFSEKLFWSSLEAKGLSLDDPSPGSLHPTHLYSHTEDSCVNSLLHF